MAIDKTSDPCYTHHVLQALLTFMKQQIHPTYHQITVTCACGNSFETGSTKDELRVELCNQCHPFYTGKQKFVDTARRVEKFEEKLAKAQAKTAVRSKKDKRAAKAANKKAKADETK